MKRPQDIQLQEQTRHNKAICVMSIIDDAIDLAEKLGNHELTKGCLCYRCITKRKRMLFPPMKKWKYQL